MSIPNCTPGSFAYAEIRVCRNPEVWLERMDLKLGRAVKGFLWLQLHLLVLTGLITAC